MVQHIPGSEQRDDILTNALERLKFKEIRGFVGIEDLSKMDFKFKEENVKSKLEVSLDSKLT